MKETLTERPPKVVVSKGARKWFITVYLHVKEVTDGFECESFSAEVDHRPTIDDVRDAIIAHIDAETDDKILSGYQWLILPVRYKVGEDSEKKPIYENFQNLQELAQFYLGGIAYIRQMLTEGWREKDAVNEWLEDVVL